MAENIKLNFEIDGLKEANKQLSELEKSAEDLKKQLDEVEEGSDAFKSINKELIQTTKQIGLLKDATGQLDLDSKFEDVYGEAVPLNTQLGELEDRMYALAAAGLQNTEGFRNLQDQVVNMRQTIVRVDESIDDLAANRGISTFGSQIAGVGESLLTLDFERASKQAQGLANSVSNVKFGGVINGVKNLGSVFINLGKALLTNPIFLIAAAIAVIVTAVVALMKKLGILKPILDAIGKVFGWIGDVIDAVVQSFKDFTDWLGLTSHAAEENAQRVADAAAKKAKATKEANEEAIQGYDNEIRMLELNGIENEKQLKKKQELEKAKAKAISDTAKQQAVAAKAELAAAKRKGELDKEEMDALRDKVRETRLAYKQTVEDIKFTNKQAEKELSDFRQKQKDEQDAADKEEDDKRKERAAKYKQYLADRLAAERQAEDLKLELMDEGFEKELELNRVKYERLKEDTLKDTKLTLEERNTLVAYYDQLRLKGEEAINKKIRDKKKEDDAKKKSDLEKSFEDQLDIERQYHDMKVEANEGNYEELRTLSQEQYDSDLYELDFKLQQELITQAQYDLLKIKAAQENADRIKEINEKAADDEKKSTEERIEKIKGVIGQLKGAFDSINGLASGLTSIALGGISQFVDLANMEFESLADKVGAYAAAIGGVLNGFVEAIAGNAAEKSQEALDKLTSDTEQQMDILDAQFEQGILSQEAYEAQKEALEKDSKAKELELKKKAFEDEKKANIATAIISGLTGAVTAFTGAMQLGPIAGPIVGGILAAAVAAMTAVNVANIKKQQFEGGGGAVGGAGGTGIPTSSAAAAPTPPSLSLFGQAMPGSEGAGQQDAGMRQQSMVKAVVVESDITNTQNRLSSYQQRSEIG